MVGEVTTRVVVAGTDDGPWGAREWAVVEVAPSAGESGSSASNKLLFESSLSWSTISTLETVLMSRVREPSAIADSVLVISGAVSTPAKGGGALDELEVDAGASAVTLRLSAGGSR